MCLIIPACLGSRPSRKRWPPSRRSASSARSCPNGSTGERPGTSGATSRSGCRSRWTPGAPFSSTSIRAHETATALRSWGAAHRELWKALWDRGCGIEVVVVVRTPEEDSRAETVLANWARDPRPSEFDHGIGREIDLIDQAIIKGDVPVLMEYGGLQAAMKRSVALTKRARRQAGRGLMQRTDTWRTVRLAGARFR